MPEQNLDVGRLEIVARIFLFGLTKDVPVAYSLGPLAAIEIELVDALDALHIHCKTLQPISQFARDRRAFNSCNLLEVGELRDLHAIAPAFPSKSPSAKRRAFPIILDEPNVVEMRIDAACF